MPYIIGTAGHIDHGKTALIKALTGQDTDRLKEEKERGISIDLGFAHFDLPDGTQAGVVDVPGHERFIRNMLAGAHGIDLVLFTVAADDGVMPQTEEHLDIVDLLGVNLAIFVVTKADLVAPSRIKEVEEEIRILTLGTPLEGSPVLAFSSLTGQGLSELREEIARAFRSSSKSAPAGYFRLPVDRAFVLQGHGIIATGTALSGEVRTGDRVRCLPGNQQFRVRSLQVHGRPLELARWGQRVALNLAGVDKVDVKRGHVICHEKLTLTSDRFDALVEIRHAGSKGIKSHQRVRVYLGTAELSAKLVILRSKEWVESKESVYCQLTLSEPVLVMRGDRFIMRDEGAQRTIGGGVVIHPWAKKHKRSETALQERLESLHSGDLKGLTTAFLGESEEFALPLEVIYQFLNLTEDAARELVEAMDTLQAISAEGETLYTTKTKWEALQAETLKMLGDFHLAHPLAPGMDMEELRGNLAYALSPRTFRAVVDLMMASANALGKDGNHLRLIAHRVQVGGQERSLMEKIKSILGEQDMAPPDLKQIETRLGVPRAKLIEVLRLMEKDGLIARVANDLYFLSSCIRRVQGLLVAHLSEKGEISAATFRDLLGSSRKYTIALLEYFDRVGTTVRVGDLRRLRSRTPQRQ
jgi:selenocysteine-specific elongation factor